MNLKIYEILHFQAMAQNRTLKFCKIFIPESAMVAAGFCF